MASLASFTTWNGSKTISAFGARARTSAMYGAHMSIVTNSIFALRSGPSSSKNLPSVFCERPSLTHAGSPVR